MCSKVPGFQECFPEESSPANAHDVYELQAFLSWKEAGIALGVHGQENVSLQFGDSHSGIFSVVQFSSVQSLSRVRLFETP